MSDSKVIGKPTPGPWEVINGTEVFSQLGSDSGDGVKARHDDGWMVADCNDYLTLSKIGMVELGIDVRKANARLISSAPCLLDALEGLLAAYEDPGNTGSTHDEKVKAARAAIAKAKGLAQ